MHTNPLRVLDTKNPALQSMAEGAPRLVDFLGEESLSHYRTLKAMLDGLGIAYVENPRLVRGLDYYNLTVFEWTTKKLGAQATVCGGGRYNGLIEELGGKPTPSIGFALGIERLLLLVQEFGQLAVNEVPDVYVLHQGEGTSLTAMKHAASLRASGLNIYVHCGDQSLKAQLKKADSSGAAIAMIIGEQEQSDETITLKNLRSHEQKTVEAKMALSLIQDWKKA